jgi:hypothetical protein
VWSLSAPFGTPGSPHAVEPVILQIARWASTAMCVWSWEPSSAVTIAATTSSTPMYSAAT